MGIRQKVTLAKYFLEAYNKPKIFGIGANKTGTTSLKTAMKEMGFTVGYQPKAEKFLTNWANRDFKQIIRYCYSAQFFQDIPFSLPYTYVVLDQAFPQSKFILTVRNDSEEWYNSLIKYHSKLWGAGSIPSKKDLEQVKYNFKEGVFTSLKLIFNPPEENIYDKIP